MFEVKKLNEDVWVAMETVEEAEELGIQVDDMTDEEWDRLEEKLEADAISWWV